MIRSIVYLIVGAAAWWLFTVADLPQLPIPTGPAPAGVVDAYQVQAGHKTAVSWAMATAVPPLPLPAGAADVYQEEKQPTEEGKGGSPGVAYVFVTERPPELRYCFTDAVPHEARPYIAAGFESWAGAYPLGAAGGADCNLVAGWIDNADFARDENSPATIWGQAWGNLCDPDQLIRPFVINFDRAVFHAPYGGLATLAAHELGHIFCLDHTSTAGNVMHPSSYSWPAATDIQAARQRIAAARFSGLEHESAQFGRAS